ncbi:unnamed protein product [Alopecurus aequalis]
MASSLTSALSSMEVMLDALMQRGIGKPDDKPKEEPPPALPTRPTVRGRPPSVISRPGSPAPWLHRPPLPPIPPPPQEEEREEEKCSINLDLERRALKAEEEVKQKDDDVRNKDEEIGGLRQQVEHYESRLSECEAKMRSVEEELQKQIAALQQMSQSVAGRVSMSQSVAGRMSMSGHHQGLSSAVIMRAPQPPATTAEEASSVKHHEQPVDVSAKQNHTDNLAEEFVREKQAFEHAGKAVAEVKPGTMSVDELKMLKRQFGAWKKEYAVRLRKAKAELRKQGVHLEKSHEQAGNGGNPRRRWCGWWRTIKAPKFRTPKRCCTCAIKFPSPSSCCSSFSCCFRRHR